MTSIQRKIYSVPVDEVRFQNFVSELHFENPETIIAYKLDTGKRNGTVIDVYKEDAIGDAFLHGRPVIEKQFLQSVDERFKQFVSDVVQASTYGVNAARCFTPGLAVSVKSPIKSIDILFCLKCHWAYLYGASDSEPITLPLSYDGCEKLKHLYESLFPSREEN